MNRDQARVFLRKEAIGKYRNDAENRRAPDSENGAQLFFNMGPLIHSREDHRAPPGRTSQMSQTVYKNEKNDWTSLIIKPLKWMIINRRVVLHHALHKRQTGAREGGGIMNVRRG